MEDREEEYYPASSYVIRNMVIVDERQKTHSCQEGSAHQQKHERNCKKERKFCPNSERESNPTDIINILFHESIQHPHPKKERDQEHDSKIEIPPDSIRSHDFEKSTPFLSKRGASIWDKAEEEIAKNKIFAPLSRSRIVFFFRCLFLCVSQFLTPETLFLV